MAIRVRDAKKNGVRKTETMRKVEDFIELGERIDRTGKARGEHKGYGALYQKGRAQLADFELPPDIKAQIDAVAEIIFKRTIIRYTENDDPNLDMPTRMFKMMIDSRVMHTIESAGVLLGVSDSTVYNWRAQHERFNLACVMGKKIQELFHASRLAAGIMYPTSAIFTMKNLHGWADKIENTHKVSIAAVIADVEATRKPVEWDTPALNTITLPSGTYERETVATGQEKAEEEGKGWDEKAQEESAEDAAKG